MKNDNASERAAALVHEAIDVLLLASTAPASPVDTFQKAKLRRELRRRARRLRARKAEPRYKNLYTSEQLADIYERTARRDEMFEQGYRDFYRITMDLERVLQENDPEVLKTLDALFLEAKRSAKEQGPGSEAAQRYQQLLVLASFGRQYHFQKRRQRFPDPRRMSLASDPSLAAVHQVTAAELLTSPPPTGETIIPIPPDGRDSGRERLLIRIGLGKASWVGSFERGHKCVSTISMMPDRKHLFVSAGGAGYVIDLKSRTLVEQVGTEVAGVMRDEPLSIFVVIHNGLSLEAFGRSGRLWKTDPIGCGGLREMALTDDDRLIGETLQSSPPGWAPFSVKLASGEVRLADAR